MSKLLTKEDLIDSCLSYRNTSKKIVLAHGHFKFFHIGHIRFLEQAKKLGDILIVSISPDGDNGVEYTEQMRSEAVSLVPAVDHVIVTPFESYEEILNDLNPDIYVKGKEYKSLKDKALLKFFEEETQACEALGISVHCVDSVSESSTDSINRFLSSFSDELQQFIQLFKQRYDFEEIKSVLEKCRALKVAVVGDTILDEYRYCHPLGTSSKDSILTVHYDSRDVFAGGILAVANHLSNFSDHVDLFTSIGDDEEEKNFISSQLSNKITPHYITQGDQKTLRKIKYIDKYSLNKIFGVYVMDDSPVKEESEDELYTLLDQKLQDYDVVVVADFGHGTISPRCRDLLSSQSKFLTLNTQANAGNKRIHTISRYKSADFISISESELRLDIRDFDSDIRPIALESSERMKTQLLAVTRGHKGSSLLENSSRFITIPAFKSKVVDRIGSGDAFFSVASLLASMTLSSELVGFIANAVGAMAVEIMGNKESVSKDKLILYLQELLE